MDTSLDFQMLESKKKPKSSKKPTIAAYIIEEIDLESYEPSPSKRHRFEEPNILSSTRFDETASLNNSPQHLQAILEAVTPIKTGDGKENVNPKKECTRSYHQEDLPGRSYSPIPSKIPPSDNLSRSHRADFPLHNMAEKTAVQSPYREDNHQYGADNRSDLHDRSERLDQYHRNESYHEERDRRLYELERSYQLDRGRSYHEERSNHLDRGRSYHEERSHYLDREQSLQRLDRDRPLQPLDRDRSYHHERSNNLGRDRPLQLVDRDRSVQLDRDRRLQIDRERSYHFERDPSYHRGNEFDRMKSERQPPRAAYPYDQYHPDPSYNRHTSSIVELREGAATRSPPHTAVAKRQPARVPAVQENVPTGDVPVKIMTDIMKGLNAANRKVKVSLQYDVSLVSEDEDGD